MKKLKTILAICTIVLISSVFVLQNFSLSAVASDDSASQKIRDYIKSNGTYSSSSSTYTISETETRDNGKVATTELYYKTSNPDVLLFMMDYGNSDFTGIKATMRFSYNMKTKTVVSQPSFTYVNFANRKSLNATTNVFKPSEFVLNETTYVFTRTMGSSSVMDDDDMQKMCNSMLGGAISGAQLMLLKGELFLEDIGFDNLINKTECTHKNTELTIIPATCTEDGKQTITCKDCGEVITTDVIKATGHAYDDGVVTKSATCTEAGVKTFTCKNCNDKKTESIAATGHAYDEGVVTKKATCTEAGVKTFTCKNCNDKKTESIAATGHAYDEGVVTKKATCTKAGVKTFTCKNCNDKKTESIAATGHKYGEYVVVKEATSTSEGQKEAVCIYCGNKDVKTIPVLDSEVIDTPKDNDNTVEPTTEDKTEAAASDTTEDKTTENVSGNSAPQTGDNMHIYIWLLVLGVSGISVSTIMKRKYN